MKMVSENRTTKNRKLNAYTLKCLGLFLIGWLGLKIASTLVQLFVMLFKEVPVEEALAFIINGDVTQSVYLALSPNSASMLVNALAYAIVALVMCLLMNKDLVEHIKSFKNGKAFVAGLVGFVLILTFNNVYRSLVNPLYPVSDNVNEESLDSIITIYPLCSILVFGILGPIVEELTYRAGLFTLTKKKNKVFAYVVTILVFAFIHFSFESVVSASQTGDTSWLINELLNMPTYMFAAAVFIYLFDNFGFAGSASAHLINNLISIVTQIIVSKL